MTSRFAQGCANGLPITSKLIVSTTCDDSNMPLAMSMITGTYAFGLVIGPSLGGNTHRNVSFIKIHRKAGLAQIYCKLKGKPFGIYLCISRGCS